PAGSVELAGANPAVQTLEGLLRLPYEAAIKTGCRVLVVFDEFQAVAGIANADAVLRSQIQHQRERVSYLFCGSERHLLQAIFADSARPLYGQAEQLRLGPLSPEAAVELVTVKFAETGREAGSALTHLVDLVGGTRSDWPSLPTLFGTRLLQMRSLTRRPGTPRSSEPCA
ncbi:MAG: hypothetical protein ACRD0J_13685, partial [Acidimicrobiales bacterium]